MNDELHSGDDTENSDVGANNSEAVTEHSRSFKIFMAAWILAMIALVVFAWVSDEHEKQAHKAAANSLSNPEIYQSALDRSDTMLAAYSQLTYSSMETIIRAMNEDSAGFQAGDVEQLKNDVEAFEDANAQFGKLRAMGNAEVQEAYTDYMDQAESYATFAKKLADSAVPLSRAFESCSDTPERGSPYDDAFYTTYEDYVKACKSDLDALQDAPDPVASRYVSSVGDYVDTLGDIIGQMKAVGTEDSVKEGTPEYTKLANLSTKLHEQPLSANSVFDLHDNLRLEQDQVDPGDELSELRDVLSANIYG